MKNESMLHILLTVLLPIGCLFLPAYGSQWLLDSAFSYELLPVYSWIPAILLVFIGLVDLRSYARGIFVIRPSWIRLLLLAALLHQIIDALIWKFHFLKSPQIAVYAVLALILYRLMFPPRFKKDQ
jgi:hypothetical protein